MVGPLGCPILLWSGTQSFEGTREDTPAERRKATRHLHLVNRGPTTDELVLPPNPTFCNPETKTLGASDRAPGPRDGSGCAPNHGVGSTTRIRIRVRTNPV